MLTTAYALVDIYRKVLCPALLSSSQMFIRRALVWR